MKLSDTKEPKHQINAVGFYFYCQGGIAESDSSRYPIKRVNLRENVGSEDQIYCYRNNAVSVSS